MNLESHDLPKVMKVKAASRKLRIAFVYSRMPFPMMRGDQLTVAHLLSFLAARGHTVDFFTLDTGGKGNGTQLEWLRRTCHKLRIYPHGKIKKLRGICAGLLKGLPIQVGIFTNSQLIHDVRSGIAGGHYDLVYVYYLRSAEVIPEDCGNDRATSVPTVLAMQLSQTLNTDRIYREQTGLFKRLLYAIELRLIRRYESHVWCRFTRSVLIGPRDVEAIQAECRRQGIEQISNWVYGAHGTDVDRFHAATSADVVPGRIVFSGSMAYEPNVQAVSWFVENCWPAIRERVPSAELVIQGRDPVSKVMQMDGKQGIVVTGTVPEVGAIIRSAAVCINPMRAAGGMQNKLIEYLACAKAVVATTVANEGIGAADGKHLIIADTASEFADSVIALLDDEGRRDDLGRAGREYVLRNWTWEAHFLNLEAVFWGEVNEHVAN